MDTAKDKLEYLHTTPFQQIPFDHVGPDKLSSWINQSENDWETLTPLFDKANQNKALDEVQNSVFHGFSPGVHTAKDDWAYGISQDEVASKAQFFIEKYNEEVERLSGTTSESEIDGAVTTEIKWDYHLKRGVLKGETMVFDPEKIMLALYRPFSKRWVYFAEKMVYARGRFPQFLPNVEVKNQILVLNSGQRTAFNVCASDAITSYDYFVPDKSHNVPLYRYDKLGNRLENITDWGLNQFRTHYGDENIAKKDIFHYVYGVLHNPEYRKKYELNLRREFPRIPFYGDFARWAAWGEKLLELHLNFETVEPYPLGRKDDRRESRLQSRDAPNVKKPKGETQSR